MKILNSQIAQRKMRQVISFEVEEFWAIALASNKKILSIECLFRGTVDACLIHPRDIFRFACRHNASGLIVAHSHPTGDAFPSDADLSITAKLMLASEIFQIPILDHLILTKTSYISFLDRGLLGETLDSVFADSHTF